MDKETLLTRNRFNRTARYYDIMERMIKTEKRKEILSHAKGKVLEVGVGTGKNLEYYSSDCEVIGIDLSPGMLEKARVKAQRLRLDLSLQEMDAQELQFPDHYFDTVVATCVFCSIPDPIKGLKEIKRVCKPGGKVLLLEHVRSENPVIGKIMDILDPITVRLVGSHINRRTIENIEKAGLRITHLEDHYYRILKSIQAAP